MRFLGLGLGKRPLNAKGIWLFRDALAKANFIESLFAVFNHMPEAEGISVHKGTIAGVAFVDAPHQRNSRKGNQAIKDGETPEDWLADTPKAKHKLAQKNVDVCWTIKNKELHYGCKGRCREQDHHQ